MRVILVIIVLIAAILVIIVVTVDVIAAIMVTIDIHRKHSSILYNHNNHTHSMGCETVMDSLDFKAWWRA